MDDFLDRPFSRRRTVGVVFFIVRQASIGPCSPVGRIQSMPRNFNTQIALRKNDEFGELADAFNHMAISLKESKERLLHEGEIRLELERSLRHSDKMATSANSLQG